MFNVYPVTAASATRWLLGEIADAGLDRGRPEVVYLNELIGRASYAAMLRECVRLDDLGCRACIAHVVNPAIFRRCLRYGGVPTLTEKILWHGQPLEAIRLVVPPAGWENWIRRIRRITAAASRTGQG